MGDGHRISKKIWLIAQIGMIAFTIVGFLKGIFISLDIDESYAVAQSYRLATGDHFFVDMWEPHQLSAFLGAWFIKVFLLVFQTTDYLVMYLRIVSALIHIALGLWLFCSLKREFDQKIVFGLAVLHLNFFPKWVQSLEFEVMHYWFMLMVVLFLLEYFHKQTSWWFCLVSGVCFVGSMMSYPTMILVYPVLLLGLYVVEKRNRNEKGIINLRSGLLFTMGAGMSGVLFIAYLLSYQSVGELIKNISFIFLDESHTAYTMAEKWSMYAIQLWQEWEIYFAKMLGALVVVAVIVLLTTIKNRSFEACKNKDYLENLLLATLILTAVSIHIDFVWGCLFLDKNQFYLQIRYAAILVPGIYLGIRYHKRMSKWFYLFVVPSVLTFLSVLLVTNMDTNISYSKMFVGVLGSALLLFEWLKENKRFFTETRILINVLACVVLISLLVCRLVMIRVTGCLPVTIKAPLERMEMGPEKGIYILDEQAQIWNDNYRNLYGIVEKEDALLYVGAENLLYPAMECTVATPSTQGTTVFNEMFMLYYEEHPEKMPNIVVIDKTMQSNPAYELFSDTHVVIEWIEDRYAEAELYETPNIKVLILER